MIGGKHTKTIVNSPLSHHQLKLKVFQMFNIESGFSILNDQLRNKMKN